MRSLLSKFRKQPETPAEQIPLWSPSPLLANRRPVGYQIRIPDDPVGVPGIGYEYLMARHGLYVQARNENIVARIPIGEKVEVKGLEGIEEKLELPLGAIDGEMFTKMLYRLTLRDDLERVASICSDPRGGYKIVEPEQEVGPSHVRYQPARNTVFQMHSHGIHSAFFSSTTTATSRAWPSMPSWGRRIR